MVIKFIKILLLSLSIISCSQKELKFTGNLSSQIYLNETSNIKTFLGENNIDAEYALLCGNDGTAAYIYKKSFSEMELVKEKNRWNSVTNKLPDVCNIKDLSNINLFLRNSKYSLYFLNNTEQEMVLSPFEAELSQYELLGKSRKNGHSVKKYKYSEKFKIETESDSVLATMKSGSEKWLKPNEKGILEGFELRDCYFVNSNDTLVSLWVNPPLMDAYDIHKKIVNNKNRDKNLYIFIDSFGWVFNEYLKSIKHKGFLSQFELESLRVPFPPRTINSYWVIGSGTSLQNRKTNDEYFADILNDDQKGLIIEADRIYYPSPIEHITHTDGNGNGTIDDEIFEKTMQYIDDDLDFLLVHFHSLDDIGHQSGAYTPERLETFKLLEKYTEQITKLWTGNVYLFSDHGMHSEGISGNHYTGSAEDMIGVWGKLKSSE